MLWAGLSGAETGNSLVEVLYGDWNPSGRLPYTIAKDPADYPAQLVTGGNGIEIINVTYSEGCAHSHLPLPFKLICICFCPFVCADWRSTTGISTRTASSRASSSGSV